MRSALCVRMLLFFFVADNLCRKCSCLLLAQLLRRFYSILLSDEVVAAWKDNCKIKKKKKNMPTKWIEINETQLLQRHCIMANCFLVKQKIKTMDSLSQFLHFAYASGFISYNDFILCILWPSLFIVFFFSSITFDWLWKLLRFLFSAISLLMLKFWNIYLVIFLLVIAFFCSIPFLYFACNCSKRILQHLILNSYLCFRSFAHLQKDFLVLNTLWSL